MLLDRDLPHDEIIGIAGVKWSQGGRYYGVAGQPMIVENGIGRMALPGELPDAGPAAAAPPPTEPDVPDFEAMPTADLKAALKVYGEAWTGRDDAIAYLRDNYA